MSKEHARTLLRGTSEQHISSQFTRRHYIWLTSAMRNVLDEATKEFYEDEILYGVERGIRIFAEILAADNHNFDQTQFLDNIFGTKEPQ